MKSKKVLFEEKYCREESPKNVGKLYISKKVLKFQQESMEIIR